MATIDDILSGQDEPLELKQPWITKARARDFSIGAVLSLVFGIPWLIGMFNILILSMESFCG